MAAVMLPAAAAVEMTIFVSMTKAFAQQTHILAMPRASS